jgi:hypothetical protein
MKKIILFTIFCSSVSLSQTQHFETTFAFTNEFNNSQSLIFGYDPFGTDGLDSQLGEVIVPQVPPGQFGVRFQLPTDTSIYTVKDIRFGCGQPFYYEHLVDLSYETGSNTIHIFWNWDWGLYMFDFKDPYTGVTLAHYELFYDSTHFIIPSYLEKIIIGVYYDGPITFPIFDLVAPNGGDTLVAGEYYNITWWTNWSFPPLGKLEFSTDAGYSWIIIADSIPHDQYTYNYYLWSVPYLNSDSCLVRVGEYPCYCDKSDNFFTITYPVKVEEEKYLPLEFSLSQNYPNPFNSSTTISYELPEGTFVSLIVYDCLGNNVQTLVNEFQNAGAHQVVFESNNLPSGLYFLRMLASDWDQTRKMVLLR